MSLRGLKLRLWIVFSVFSAAGFCGGNNVVELKKNVKIFRQTGVCIERIPQVNQRRNYCVPATVSMVLRYYDSRIPQKRLARLFETSGKKGTYMEDVEEAFNRGRLEKFTIKPIYRLTVNEFDELEKTLLERRGKKRKRKRSVRVQSYEKRINAMNPAEARKYFPAIRGEAAEKLRESLTGLVANGIPVLWCVEMRFDPEERANGGHMRLINGFIRNKDSGRIDRIVYRDSWGGASRNKVMDFNDAVTMTTALWVILQNN